ncbi:SDR family oxidoreductase [Streptosporangium sp. NPDC000509]|uniref:SDR family oxidoreductase n=1 Tax=Streptosporangium sp. NPDC000509 TaxID=3366186 RepID=UPI0036ADAC28
MDVYSIPGPCGTVPRFLSGLKAGVSTLEAFDEPRRRPEAEEERRLTALDRYCDPGDIAATVAHLAGDGGRNITGATITVDTGTTA